MTFYLIRGLPGSGKSTFAKSLGCLHLEADMFHVRQGVYTYDPNKGREGHRWCRTIAEVAAMAGVDIAVSNTFTQEWEMAPYLDIARDFGYEVKIIRMTGSHRTIHNVPDEIIEKMRARFEDVEGEEIA